MKPATLARYIYSLQPRPIALRVNAEDFESVLLYAGATRLDKSVRFCGVDIEMVDGLSLPEPVYSRA